MTERFAAVNSEPPCEADPLVGRAVSAYQLQAVPSGRLLNSIAAIQDLWPEPASAGLYRIPRRALHLTVQPLIDPIESFARATSEVWRDHGQRFRRAIEAGCALAEPFVIRFVEVRRLGRAVVMLGERSPQLAALRANLAATCGLPERPARTPDIVHISLFRNLETTASDSAPSDGLDGLLPLEMPVRRLRLVHERAYPSTSVSTLAIYRLEDQPTGGIGQT